ncbi:MAG: YkgJ family cysteine cluster protein [Desulforhopalus sp.]
MKHQILHTLYEKFATWSGDIDIACRRGCSGCCTQNVTITALEGVEILRYAVAEGLAAEVASRLAQHRSHMAPEMTTNDFAGACLDGRDADPGGQQNLAPCPFLEDDLCRIYPVRPFGCRLFISTRTCSAAQPALVPDYHFEGATAASQMIEHLGQKEYWGNMLDVLPALLDISEFKEIAEHLDSALILRARLRTLTAKPLPGFLFSEENGKRVAVLLESIFHGTVEGRRIDDILNGKS